MTVITDASRWLQQWTLATSLDKVFGIPEPPDIEVNIEAEIADVPLEAGQVRILRSRYVLRDDYVPMVLILRWAGDWWRAIPFAPPPFDVPATTGEMAIPTTDCHLKVLQVWNTRTAPPAILTQSWVYGDKLTPDVLKGAHQLFAHLIGGQPLPEDFPFERGPRLTPATPQDDPRRKYLRLFNDQFHPLTTAAIATT